MSDELLDWADVEAFGVVSCSRGSLTDAVSRALRSAYAAGQRDATGAVTDAAREYADHIRTMTLEGPLKYYQVSGEKWHRDAERALQLQGALIDAVDRSEVTR